MRLSKSLCAAIAAVFACSLFSQAKAQANTAEVAGGLGFGHYSSSGTGFTKFKLDASVSYNILKNISAGFEYGYSPYGNLAGSGAGFTTSGSLQNYGGVLHFGIGQFGIVQPYALFAGGGEHSHVTASAGNLTQTENDNGGYFGFGGGVNLKLPQNFGVRPEFRYQHDSVGGTGINEIDFTGTVFYTFGGIHMKK